VFSEKLAKFCAASLVVDPALAVPNVKGGDYLTFEKFMDGSLADMTEALRKDNGTECQLRPVRRAAEPHLTISAGWTDYQADAVKASRLSALEAIDQLTRMRNPRN